MRTWLLFAVALGVLGALLISSILHAQNAPSVWNSDSPNWTRVQEEAAQRTKPQLLAGT